jgi:hypothetical protein
MRARAYKDRRLPDQINPFADDPRAQNPYAAPPPLGAAAGARSSESIRPRLLIPAIVLIVMVVLTLAHRLIDLVYFVYLWNSGVPIHENAIAGALIFDPLVIVLNLLILGGCIAMLRMKSLTWARAGAILAVVPICAPCLVLGIPFGIWAIVILYQPEAEAAFA